MSAVLPGAGGSPEGLRRDSSWVWVRRRSSSLSSGLSCGTRLLCFSPVCLGSHSCWDCSRQSCQDALPASPSKVLAGPRHCVRSSVLLGLGRGQAVAPGCSQRGGPGPPLCMACGDGAGDGRHLLASHWGASGPASVWEPGVGGLGAAELISGRGHSPTGALSKS